MNTFSLFSSGGILCLAGDSPGKYGDKEIPANQWEQDDHVFQGQIHKYYKGGRSQKHESELCSYLVQVQELLGSASRAE